MVTNNYVRAPKVDQRQATNREALIHAKPAARQARTVGVCSLLAWGCSHLRCLVQETRVQLDRKPASAPPEMVDLIWSRAENSIPAMLSVKVADSVGNKRGKATAPPA